MNYLFFVLYFSAVYLVLSSLVWNSLLMLDFILILADSLPNQNMLQKVNICHLFKEATQKEKSFKTQLLFTSNDEKPTKTERIWKHSSFFNDQKGDFTISKINFPENTLVYTNQGTVSTIKGDYAFNIDYVILKQVIPARNTPENITEYQCPSNSVKLFAPLYYLKYSEFLGLDQRLDYIYYILWSKEISMKRFSPMTMMKISLKRCIQFQSKLCQIFIKVRYLRSIYHNL